MDFAKREYSSDSSASEDEVISRKKRKRKKKLKKSKKSKKSKKQKKLKTEEDDDDLWVEKGTIKSEIKRDNWMVSNDFSLATFTNEKKDKDAKSVKDSSETTYDPATSSRELNPYFKTGEGGLPSSSSSNFQRPKDDDDDYGMYHQRNYSATSSLKSNWKKQSQNTSSQMTADHDSSPPSVPEKAQQKQTSFLDLDHSDYMSDTQMNKLGAKLLKAELTGNHKLIEELKSKLERAREYKRNNKDVIARTKDKDAVVLSLPTPSGMNRPVENDDRERRKHNERKKHKRIETHESGERTRFYPDDGKYDIKQMFEKEKFSDGRDQDLEFAKAISNVKESSRMDMDEIFSDVIRKDGKKKSNEYDNAVRESQRTEKILDACYKCFDSQKMNRSLVVHVGKTIYLSIPYHEALVPHHLIISPIQHVSCLTMIDEEVWHEFLTLKKALSKFFASRGEDVVFFETVKYINRHPHMEIQMMSSKEFEMIQFYFKKAIQESESTVNKKLIDIKNEKNIRSSVPRGLPYFYIDFGYAGMAHVIEDQEKFPSNFAQEIIGGMLNLDVNRWRKPRKELQPEKRVSYFNKLFKDLFDNL